MKLKVFMWQVFHDKLQTGGELKKGTGRGMNVVPSVRCWKLETTFFSLAQALPLFGPVSWKFLDGTPLDFQDCMEGWIPLGCDNYKLKLFVLGVVLWILWITRNKFAIEGVCPNTPSDIIYKILLYLQRWRVLLKSGDQSAMDDKVPGLGLRSSRSN
jgi:hypothetical protein